MIGMICVLAAMTGCKDYEEAELDRSPVNTTLTFTVSSMSRPTTRMEAAIVQATNTLFRGLQGGSLRTIPFATEGPVTADDRPLRENTDAITPTTYDRSGTRFYYYDNCSLMIYLLIASLIIIVILLVVAITFKKQANI